MGYYEYPLMAPPAMVTASCSWPAPFVAGECLMVSGVAHHWQKCPCSLCFQQRARTRDPRVVAWERALMPREED